MGLLVVRDGATSWCNDAAEQLVRPHGAAWHGPSAPLALLAAIPSGARRAPVWWPSPSGSSRRWRVTCSRLDPGGPDLLYEIVDETAEPERQDAEPGPVTADWPLARVADKAGIASWSWNVREDVVEWSDELRRLFEVTPGTPLSYDDYRGRLHPDDVETFEATLAEAMAERTPFSFTHRVIVGQREMILECHGEVVADADGAPARLFGTARDVTVHHRAQQELAYLANHDPLTGMANRHRITGQLAESGRGPDGAALLLIDIDNFKDINELHGHATGDRVIRRVAATITVETGSTGVPGRLGGDEFAVVLPGADATRGMALANRLCAAVAAGPVLDDIGPLRVTLSIGVAVALDDDVEASLAQAELALYAAKNAGRNRAEPFANDQYDQAVRRVSLLQRVQNALDQDTMQLDAQPIVDLATGHPSRYELLIRLRDGNFPLLGPVDFLPAAEQTDLVLRLDRWVLQRANGALAMPRARARDLRLEVNVSARSLEDGDLGRWILAGLAEADVEPRRLGLEITETAAIGSVAAARALATRLVDAGCGFALDDFGAGFGSFSYLKHLPFTAVKIAGEFVRQLDRDPVDRALVSAVVGVAKQLGMRTVAEQVDRAQLIGQLRVAGVDDGQGYYLGRPRPLDP
ncbi:MAG TPA: EAL domain-containing protein [Pseudonocardia sp.]|nr:EAL domain-containing protein [Pseudonocardia sp.]